MKTTHLLIAVAGALGLSASVALAQQAGPSFADHETMAEQAATEAAAPTPAAETLAEPRSDEEVLADHRADFFARIEARRKASEGIQGQAESRSALKYNPAW